MKAFAFFSIFFGHVIYNFTFCNLQLATTPPHLLPLHKLLRTKKLQKIKKKKKKKNVTKLQLSLVSC